MRLTPLLAAIALTGCNQNLTMSDQSKYKEYEGSPVFANDRTVQAPPEGTVARETDTRDLMSQRPQMSVALIERGQQQFNIFCSACHGYTGDADGMVVQRGFPQPPSLHDARLIAAPDSHFIDVITNGHGVMYSYADRVSVADRWAITAYIRALQLSRMGTTADIPSKLRPVVAAEQPK